MPKFFVAVFLAITGVILVGLVDGASHPNFSKIGFSVLGGSIIMIMSIIVEGWVAWRKEGDAIWPFSLVSLFINSHIRDGEFDKNHSGRIIKKTLKKELANSNCKLLLMGTTLNSLLGDNGMLLNMLNENDYRLAKKLATNKSTIQILILNPYSLQGIIRSISESDPFDKEQSPLDRLMNHLDKYHDYRIYKDFTETYNNIRRINTSYDSILECKLYNCVDPAFSIISHDSAIKEDLILSHQNIPNDKLSGRMPLFLYGNGRIKDDLESYFMFVWKNFSIPYEEYLINLEEKYLSYNRFIILINLQKLYWEKRWAEGRLPFNKITKLYDIAKGFIHNNNPRLILDLGCGEGGGGSLELARDAIEKHNSKIHLVDYSSSALNKYKVRYCDNFGGNHSSVDSHISVYSKDMLSFLNIFHENYYDCVYASMSIIYMPKLKSIEIFKKIYDVLKPKGKLFASFFTVNYFKLDTGESQDVQERPNLEFMKIPAPDHENLQIIVRGERRGEIRRFYHNKEELKAEIIMAGFNESFCMLEYGGKAEQVIYLLAEKQ